MAKTPKKLTVEALKHDEATRKNIPTAEYQSVMQKNEQDPVRVALQRGVAGLEEEKAGRNRDLDPQFVWRGKDEQDWSDLVVHAPPLYIQEKVHPKVLIDDLVRRTQVDAKAAAPQFDHFADFNGMPKGVDKTEFYQHDQNWSNRMILGDSLQVMASLAERKGLRGKVQCIYLDPPYGIKFNSNFQWSTTSRDVKDGNTDHIPLKSIANNAEIDVIWDKWQSVLEPLRESLNTPLKKQWPEWEIPREAESAWPAPAKKLHADCWQARIARQKEIDASIAAKAEFEYLYDKPYDDKKKVRVAGPGQRPRDGDVVYLFK